MSDSLVPNRTDNDVSSPGGDYGDDDFEADVDGDANDVGAAGGSESPTQVAPSSSADAAGAAAETAVSSPSGDYGDDDFEADVDGDANGAGAAITAAETTVSSPGGGDYDDDTFEADADGDTNDVDTTGGGAADAIIKFFEKTGLSEAAVDLRESFRLPHDAEALCRKANSYLHRIKPSSSNARRAKHALLRLIETAWKATMNDIFRRLACSEGEERGVFIDTRSCEERASPPFFRADAALRIPLDTLRTLEAGSTSGLILGLPGKKETPVVAFANTGIRALKAQAALEDIGYCNIRPAVLKSVRAKAKVLRPRELSPKSMPAIGDPTKYLKAGDGPAISRAAKLDQRNEREFLSAEEEVQQGVLNRNLFSYGVPAQRVHEALSPCDLPAAVSTSSTQNDALSPGEASGGRRRVVLSSVDAETTDLSRRYWTAAGWRIRKQKENSTHKNDSAPRKGNSAPDVKAGGKRPFLKRGEGARADQNSRCVVHSRRVELDATEALTLACESDDAQAASKILSGPSRSLSTNDVANPETMHMPLHIASIHGSSKVAMTLLKLGANANARCRGGWTPLHECSANGHATVAEALHSKGGADLEARGDGGWTALHVAAFYNQVQVVQRLLQLGARVNSKASWGNTPLHEAACRGSVDAARVLMQHSASIETTNNDKQAPIDLVSFAPQQHQRALRKLLTAGGGGGGGRRREAYC